MFSNTHITTTTARDSRSVLLAEENWRFARRKPHTLQTTAAPRTHTHAQATSRTSGHSAPTPLRTLRPQVANSQRVGVASLFRQGSRVALPLAVTAVAIALTASVDSIARVVLGGL